MCFISAGLFTHVRSWRDREERKAREREGERWRQWLVRELRGEKVEQIKERRIS